METATMLVTVPYRKEEEEVVVALLYIFVFSLERAHTYRLIYDYYSFMSTLFFLSRSSWAF